MPPPNLQGSASASSQDTFNAWSSAKNKLQDHSVEQVLPTSTFLFTCVLHSMCPMHKLHQRVADRL